MIVKISNNIFNPEKQKLTEKPIFNQVITYLIEQQNQEVTLRDIKKNVSETTDFDRLIDNLIDSDFVERYHGKYSFSGVFVSKEKQKMLNEQTINYLNNEKISFISQFNEEVKLLPVEERFLIILYELFKDQYSSKITVYEQSDQAKKWLRLPTRYTEVQVKKARYISMGRYVPYYSNNFVDFFNYLKMSHNESLDSFVRIRNKIGDVNQEYFLNYCERKLRRLEKGKELWVQKNDIFMETLFEMGYIAINKDQYSFNMVRLSSEKQIPSLLKIRTELIENIQGNSLDRQELMFIVSCIIIEWLEHQNLIQDFKKYHGVL
ncbi:MULTISPECIES: DUF1803 domain-containing protein [Vagococcus]|uniref:Uncharacterized protein n=1 Tax=Vagococcus fluvialis bH819 TaxID=1255619 RepID=A0A1X6WND8_9ENTE|nr:MULTISPECIES: DUF1803 domain-containing protein [Vagococcus]SLM85841.1 hypothetical protein FM121_07050 [Vagococcus fluvialis bH819]HCM90263.1 DUF1803 domain-containing protein [Vagococcus sp.]